MEKIYDETFASEGRASRNIWYKGANLTKDSEYGKIFHLTDEVQNEIIKLVHENLEDKTQKVTETNFYFYDSATNQDAMNDQVRISLMLREKDGQFVALFNMTDHNFAINLDQTLQIQAQLTERLLTTIKV